MFLKMKIYITILSLYEIFAILFLHSKTSCNSIFTNGFCTDSIEKYVVFCVAVPVIFALLVMWIGEIRKYIRRRHSLFYKAKNIVQDVATEIKDKVSESVSSKYLEKILATLLILAVKKYADKSPKAREIMKEIIGFDIVDEESSEEQKIKTNKTKNKKNK